VWVMNINTWGGPIKEEGGKMKISSPVMHGTEPLHKCRRTSTL
jgi:hypothetical protein